MFVARRLSASAAVVVLSLASLPRPEQSNLDRIAIR